MAPSTGEYLQYIYGTSSPIYLLVFAISTVLFLCLLLVMCSFFRSLKKNQVNISATEKSRSMSDIIKMTNRFSFKNNEAENGVITKGVFLNNGAEKETKMQNEVETPNPTILANGAAGMEKMSTTNQHIEANNNVSIHRELPLPPESNINTEIEDPLYDIVNASTNSPKQEGEKISRKSPNEVQNIISKNKENENLINEDTTNHNNTSCTILVNDAAGTEKMSSIECRANIITIEEPLYDTVNEPTNPPKLKEKTILIETPNEVQNISENKEIENIINGDVTTNQKNVSSPIYSVVYRTKTKKQNSPIEQNNINSHGENSNSELLHMGGTAPHTEEENQSNRSSMNVSEKTLTQAQDTLTSNTETLTTMYNRAKQRKRNSINSQKKSATTDVIISEIEDPPPIPEKQFDVECELQAPEIKIYEEVNTSEPQ
ncbi:uncharacterized protein LOC128655921 [Bombina bombina]|uniref:uncharacterized protein LOC128655921 n=1 Tax=Bombina bombina TaxID=8345 RepID=UPI00235B2BB4|nr:uncharacterized protein LOC128655921 [Bombina bombina]XP_053565501.1 uncharacterized protein LOC128655921 [Bombina bombina]